MVFRTKLKITAWLAWWLSDRLLRCVSLGSIPARYKYLYGLQVVVPGLAVCVCDFSMFVNAPTVQELFKVWGNILLQNGSCESY